MAKQFTKKNHQKYSEKRQSFLGSFMDSSRSPQNSMARKSSANKYRDYNINKSDVSHTNSSLIASIKSPVTSNRSSKNLGKGKNETKKWEKI